MKLGNDFSYLDPNRGNYEVIYCFKADGEYDGGINLIKDKSNPKCYFFKRVKDTIKIYNVLGYDRSLVHFPPKLIQKILENYNE